MSVSKNSIKNLFDELLREKRFKYIISVKITLNKRLNDNEFDPKTLYFNSLIKTVINRRYHLNDSFEEILNLLDIWLNEGSGWIIDKIQGLYINVANYEPISDSSYISLPKVLNNSIKGLINLKNKDHNCFIWCHVRLILLITKKDKFHYMFIKDISRLMFSRTKQKGKKHYCMSC